MREDCYYSVSCGKPLRGSIEQPALLGYDQITFLCLQFYRWYELASQAAVNQPTGVFVVDCLLTGRLQVRILFEESNVLELASRAFLPWEHQPGLVA